jgi:hypothetical protein
VKDLAIELQNRPGALAEMGDALGRAGVSVEGGGVFVVNGVGVAPATTDPPAAHSKRGWHPVLAEREVPGSTPAPRERVSSAVAWPKRA